MSQTPKLEQVIEAAIDERLGSFMTAIVATVLDYDSDSQRADIQISIVNRQEGQDGEPVAISWPRVNHVPVIFPGSGEYRATFPINRGDWVLYIVTTLPIADWFKSGGSVALTESPQALNNKRSGFVIPGLFTARNVPTRSPSDSYTIHGDVRLGGHDAEELLAIKKDIQALRYALQTAIIAIGAGGAGSVVTAADAIATTLAGGGGTLPPGVGDGVWPLGTSKVKGK